MDPNVTPPADVEPGWSETRFFTCFDRDSGAGLFVHAGRQLTDLGLWWVHVMAWLPGGRVAVERVWGRPSGTDLDFSGFDQRVGETFKTWSASYDGGAEISTAERLSRAVGGAGVAAPIRFDVQAEATWPPFELNPEQEWAHLHNEQLFRCTGSLTVGDESFTLDGPGADDHSTGKRDLSTFARHSWFLAQWEDRGMHALRIEESGRLLVTGAVFTADGSSPVESFDIPPLADALGGPAEFEAQVNGETYGVEILHAMPLSATDANDNLAGIPHDTDDLVVFVECPARFTAPDGAVGYGHLERSGRRRDLF